VVTHLRVGVRQTLLASSCTRSDWLSACLHPARGANRDCESDPAAAGHDAKYHSTAFSLVALIVNALVVGSILT